MNKAKRVFLRQMNCIFGSWFALGVSERVRGNLANRMKFTRTCHEGALRIKKQREVFTPRCFGRSVSV